MRGVWGETNSDGRRGSSGRGEGVATEKREGLLRRRGEGLETVGRELGRMGWGIRLDNKVM